MAAGCTGKEDEKTAKGEGESGEQEPAKTSKKAGPGKSLFEDFELTPVMKKSQFADKLSKNTYPDAATPADAGAPLRWDFSKKRKLAYDYKQKVKSSMDMGMGGPSKQSMNAAAKLSVNAKGNNLADIVLKFEKVSTEMNVGGNTRSMDMNPPPIAIQDIGNNSVIPDGGQYNMLLKLLFPLPGKALKVGESAESAAKLPFNVAGSLLWIKGKTVLTLVRYVTVDNHTCAYVRIDSDISKLDIPEGVEGKYETRCIGKGFFYFDTVDKCFESGELAFFMSIRGEMPVPRSPRMPDSGGKRKISMDNDNLITFKRK